METGKLRHTVLFRFVPEATAEDKERVTQAFAALREKIPGIVAFECGLNNSPEGLDQGFTRCFMLTFASEAARDAYLPHPEHKAFGDLLNGLIAGVFVADWWANG